MVGHDLQRSLGLYSTMMISMGAMIGSGIFVLPALGYKKAGPAVILSYVLAAIVVLPAALSNVEMATAMPESGGTYLYIERREVLDQHRRYGFRVGKLERNEDGIRHTIRSALDTKNRPGPRACRVPDPDLL
jgi:hypothetical protein